METKLQMASYAVEALSDTVIRNYIIQVEVADRVIRVWYYDRCGIMNSTAIDIFSVDFAIVIFCFMRFRDEDWGFFPNPIRPGAIFDLDNGITVKLVDFIEPHRYYGLVGRCTNVLTATSDEFPDTALIVKASFQPRTRLPREAEVIDQLKARLPDKHDNLPTVYGSKVIPVTSSFRTGLPALARYLQELRDLVIMLCQPLNAITSLETVEMFKKAFCDIVRCVYIIECSCLN